MTTEPLAALDAAIRDGSTETLAAWTATGAAGLAVLRDVLTGARSLASDASVHPRVAIDNLSAAVATIAATHPEAFLEVFADDRLDANGFVLTGLGQIDDPRATERLARSADSSDESARMHAAIGLGRRSSPVASGALARLLDDAEYLVRYHTLRSLAAIGADAALPSLRRFAPTVPIERTLADEAIAAIERRAAGGAPSG